MSATPIPHRYALYVREGGTYRLTLVSLDEQHLMEQAHTLNLSDDDWRLVNGGPTLSFPRTHLNPPVRLTAPAARETRHAR